MSSRPGKVFPRARHRNDPLSIRDSIEELNLGIEVLVELEDGSDVATAVAIVGGRPHGDKLLVKR